MDETTKNEDTGNQTTCSTSKKDETTLQSSQVHSDAKNSPDKSTQARIVRSSKKIKLEVDPGPANEKKDVKDEENTDTKVVRSLKRSCELWSTEDKNIFFKALNEYGKDFDALQSYFLAQGKKRGLPDVMIKNKEQIRHFYYRTWLKISKHLKFSEDVKKTSQELYGLINYGELRRKLPRIHEKVHLKLNELIYWGSTQVRLRGKTMRIKTPICRALRRLNQLEDWQEEIKLPSKISVELRPRNNMAWWQVQATSMNPRVRTLLPIQRRLSTLLAFLQQRWCPLKYKTVSFGGMHYTCADTENLITNDGKDTRLLHVAPTEGCKISLPIVNLGEYLTSNSVSLNSYEKCLGLKSSKEDLLGAVQYLKSVGKKGIKKYKLDKKTTHTDDQCEQIPYNDDAIESAGSACEKTVPVNNEDTKKPNTEPNYSKLSEPNRFPGRETVDRIRKGWNIEEANTITIGDLFLMFGRESKIVLEYWWDVHPQELTNTDISLGITRDDSLCLALQKLLSLAKHAYGTSKVYYNTSGSNETVVSSRVPFAKESAFRRPLIRQTYHKIGAHDAFKTQLDKFQTRFSKRGRTVRQKSLVVQRVLPIVSSSGNVSLEEPELPTEQTNKVGVAPLSTENVETDKEPTIEMPETRDKIFLDELQGNAAPKLANTNSIITSATQILKEGEQQWLNSEVADFSLSSFLGQLESPMKISQRSQGGDPIIDDTRPSSDVVSNLQCLMGENSVDYMAKFANLASQIASDEKKKNEKLL